MYKPLLVSLDTVLMRLNLRNRRSAASILTVHRASLLSKAGYQIIRNFFAASGMRMREGTWCTLFAEKQLTLQ